MGTRTTAHQLITGAPSFSCSFLHVRGTLMANLLTLIAVGWPANCATATFGPFVLVTGLPAKGQFSNANRLDLIYLT